MKCPYCKKEIGTSNRILKILKEPTTVTKLKNKLKGISSFGTIAYHLKKLEKKGLIKKYKIEYKKVGTPTFYIISKKKWEHYGDGKFMILWK